MSDRTKQLLALSLKTKKDFPEPCFGETCIEDENTLENSSTQDVTIGCEGPVGGGSFEDKQIQQEILFEEKPIQANIFEAYDDVEILQDGIFEDTEMLVLDSAADSVREPVFVYTNIEAEPCLTDPEKNDSHYMEMSQSQTSMIVVMHEAQIHQKTASGDATIQAEPCFTDNLFQDMQMMPSETANTVENPTQFTTIVHSDADMDSIVQDVDYREPSKDNSVEVLRNIDLNLNANLLSPGVYTIEIFSGDKNNKEPCKDLTPDPVKTPPGRSPNETISCNQECNDGTNPAEEQISMANKKKRQRKKPSNKQSWEKNESSSSRMVGEQYVGRTKDLNDGKIKYNKTREARSLGPPCNSRACERSEKRLCNKINEEMRKKIFTHFWSDMTWAQRKTYVASLVDCGKPKQKRRKDSGDRKGNTFHFHLKVNGERKEVCRSFFCNTLSLGVWSAQNWAKNVNHGIPQINKKGTTAVAANCSLSESAASGLANTTEKVKFVEEFLDWLPKMESHYCRKDSSKLYLEPVFTSKSDLYRVYKNKCLEMKKKSMSIHTFMKVYNSKKISLFRPKKDQCDTCIGYKVGSISAEYFKIHEEAKEIARKEKERDKFEMEQNKSKGVVLCVDVQAVKCAPFITASAIYFKTKLCCHNYTVYNIITHETDCYWWDESEGELGSTTFTSLLITHLQQLISSWDPKVHKHIIIWSDGCVYQNKNNVLANALLEISVKHGFIIEQKYLEVGHTQMEGDSVHATIERKLKNREIHLPSDYVSVTREARIEPFPYKAHYITHEVFLDYSKQEALRYSSIRPGNKIGDPTVNDVCHLVYLPAGKIMFKTKFQDDAQELPRRPKCVTQPIKYLKLYSSRIKIKTTKFNHLQQLKSVIPKDTHHFYDSLPHF